MNTVTYNWRSIIINKKKKKKKRRREKCLRNETYRSVGWERGKAPLVRRGGKASPAWRKAKHRRCGGNRSVVDAKKGEASSEEGKASPLRRRQSVADDLETYIGIALSSFGLSATVHHKHRCCFVKLGIFFFFDQKLIRRVVKASVLIGIEIGLVWEYL